MTLGAGALTGGSASFAVCKGAPPAGLEPMTGWLTADAAKWFENSVGSCPGRNGIHAQGRVPRECRPRFTARSTNEIAGPNVTR